MPAPRGSELFVGDTHEVAEFARRWWAARRVSQAHGERAGGGLGSLFDEVSGLLEDHDDELLSARELRESVTRLLPTLGALSGTVVCRDLLDEVTGLVEKSPDARAGVDVGDLTAEESGA